MKKEDYWLSLVIIGRNEASRLPALFDSLPSGDDIEWIYVDSYSDDGSKAIAIEKGASVFEIDEDSVYAPGTGRHIGTIEAAGRWILYLDGDMTLREEFVFFMERLKREEELLPPKTAGFVGRTRNHLLDSTGEEIAVKDFIVLEKKEMGPSESWGKPASYHGGAVLYLREAVIKAGNWNPSVYQLEEIDLYSRIQALGKKIRAVDLPMAEHFTPYLSPWERLKLNFLPSYRGKMLYGAGQVVTARYREGGLIQFIRSYPFPFIVLGGLVFIPLLYLVWGPLPWLVNAIIATLIGKAKKWYYYLVYLGNVVQMVRGIGHYSYVVPFYRRVEE
jgi:glycosyltransferase involved in cell wall biosynthesis